MSATLNVGQKAAIEIAHGFLSSTAENYMVIEGAGGTGKTFVAKHLVESLDAYHKTREILGLKGKGKLPVFFTATTNKACEALSQALDGKYSVQTIHSHLRLTLAEDPNDPRKEVLIERDPGFMIGKALLFIDEASYVDDELMAYIIQKSTKDTKVIFMGDPAQLKNANSTRMPAFDSGFRRAELTQIERYGEDTPIFKLGVELRKRILDGDFRIPPCPVDGKHIVWLPRDKFDALMQQDMKDPDWTYSTSKFLAFRNKCVQRYNKNLNEVISGTRNFVAGDYAVNNHHVSGTKTSGSIGTDRMVFIDAIKPATEFDVPGFDVYLDGKSGRRFFLPGDHSRIEQKAGYFIRKYQAACANDDFENADNYIKAAQTIKNTWVDLRPVYAQTVYKAQGSTFRRVYIDLADIGACPNKETQMRMLYVACSRAQKQLFLTGDIY